MVVNYHFFFGFHIIENRFIHMEIEEKKKTKLTKVPVDSLFEMCFFKSHLKFMIK